MGRKLTQEQFIERCKIIHPEYNYSKIVYINSRTDITVTCETHGDFKTTPNRFIMGAKCGCPKCNPSALKDSLTKEIFIERCKRYFPNYDYSKVIYTNQYNKIEVTCDVHKHTWFSIAKDLMNGHGCPLCGRESSNNKQRSSLNEFIVKANEIHNNKYDYSKVLYVNSKTKVEIICPIHGSFMQSPGNHINQKQGCPKCHECYSKGELSIKNYLDSCKVVYVQQYPINYKGNQSGITKIDFYLPNHNIFIEYNGMQHYIPVDYFGGELKFQKQIHRDNFLRNYCKDNNIKLIEIRYDENVSNKLKYELGI